MSDAAFNETSSRLKSRRLGGPFAAHAALLLICLGFGLPFFWMLSTSLKTADAALETPPRLMPEHFEWKNYPKALTHERIDLILCTRNTLTIAALAVGGMTLSSALV